ncbi:agmatinase family protein [Pajaroellobacter abortibovis]|uniref:Arginase n=1 Tax=Pajaroellobacter abortibovis TaxID=1882918 RepID=A0A1L6MW61_9BACT|nr:agmatinase family protein [Pajaroellobacter abortibovis]APR99751.1 hypothetical protein BCY86_02970 [Pajaroellobacter abortibovis]
MNLSFDPNAPTPPSSGIFGLPFSQTESSLIYLPVPWEATTSYGGGTSRGPMAILEASHQVDLYDLEVERPYEAGLYMLPESPEVHEWNHIAKQHVEAIRKLPDRTSSNALALSSLDTTNRLGNQLNHHVYSKTKEILYRNQLPGIVGGEHSVSFGAIQAAAEYYTSFGILHLDAHFDLRANYEGFQWSHASIMYNVLKHIPQVNKIVQVGIRDAGEEEATYAQSQPERVYVFDAYHLNLEKFKGTLWGEIASCVLSPLPEQVWISFDIDVLDPSLCPHTGTPVPGGLSFQEAVYLLAALVHSGRRIVGFDLTEVSPPPLPSQDEWDANVGARILYKLSAWTLASHHKVKILKKISPFD